MTESAFTKPILESDLMNTDSVPESVARSRPQDQILRSLPWAEYTDAVSVKSATTSPSWTEMGDSPSMMTSTGGTSIIWTSRIGAVVMGTTGVDVGSGVLVGDGVGSGVMDGAVLDIGVGIAEGACSTVGLGVGNGVGSGDGDGARIITGSESGASSSEKSLEVFVLPLGSSILAEISGASSSAAGNAPDVPAGAERVWTGSAVGSTVSTGSRVDCVAANSVGSSTRMASVATTMVSS